jgi:hypothetical protein
MGYDVALIFLPAPTPDHVAIGIAISGVYGSYYEVSGKKYFYLETTGEGFEIGQIPTAYQGASAYVYPVE